MKATRIIGLPSSQSPKPIAAGGVPDFEEALEVADQLN